MGRSVSATRIQAEGAIRGGWLVLAVFAATLLAYLPAVNAEFIWNDSDYVTAPHLRSLAGLGRIWFELGATEQYYPVLHSAFWIEHKLWGDSPAGYHLLNIFLHAGCACLLAAVLRRLVIPGAWLAAFIFALHPVYVESVAWISEQKNTLSLLFFLLAALVYLRFDAGREAVREFRWYVAATALFVIALLSKSTTAVLPPALLVVFWWRRGRLEWRRDVVPLLPWFVLGAAMGLLSAHVEKVYVGAQGAEFALTSLQRTLLAGRVVWFYFGKLIWPGELIFIYPRWHIDPAQAWQWLFLAGAVVLLVLLWRWRHRSRAPLAAALLFGGSLFPVMGFLNVYAFLFSFVADHWQYLPSIALVALGAAALTRLLNGPMAPAGEPMSAPGRQAVRWRAGSGDRRPASGTGLEGRGRRWRRGVPVLLVAALGVLTFQQSRMYADIRTFYRTTVARNPAAWMAHNNLGNLLRGDGRLEEAVAHFRAALNVRPDLNKVHNNLALTLHDMRRPEEAKEHYRRALAIDPGYGEAHNNLGRLLRELGRPDEALGHLVQALRAAPDDPDVHNNLGMVLRDLGRLPEAIVFFERSIRRAPHSVPSRLNMALTLSMLGRDSEAMEHYREARRLNPALPQLPGS
jgi:protein O-mannosyl-transferase